jgi:hypothetical protein
MCIILLFKATKVIHSEITTSNNLINTLITIPYQENVLEKKMPKKIDLVNVLTDDLVNNYIYYFTKEV